MLIDVSARSIERVLSVCPALTIILSLCCAAFAQELRSSRGASEIFVNPRLVMISDMIKRFCSRCVDPRLPIVTHVFVCLSAIVQAVWVVDDRVAVVLTLVEENHSS